MTSYPSEPLQVWITRPLICLLVDVIDDNGPDHIPPNPYKYGITRPLFCLLVDVIDDSGPVRCLLYNCVV